MEQMTEEFMKQIKTCGAWLMNKPTSREINYDINSNGICAIITKELKTSISKDAFLIAAMLLEIPYRENRTFGNIYIAISTPELLKNININ